MKTSKLTKLLSLTRMFGGFAAKNLVLIDKVKDFSDLN